MARAILRFEHPDGDHAAKAAVTALQDKARELGFALELVTLTGHDAHELPPENKATAVWVGIDLPRGPEMSE